MTGALPLSVFIQAVISAGPQAVTHYIAQPGNGHVADGAIEIEGWRLRTTANAWYVTQANNGAVWFAGTFDQAAAIWAAFIEAAPESSYHNRSQATIAKLQEIIRNCASQETHQKRAAGKRMPPAEIDKILTAHFNSHPSHWNSGRGGKTAVSAVAAATGLPVSTISEWADENSTMRASAAVDCSDVPPLTTDAAEAAEIDTTPMQAQPNDAAAAIVPAETVGIIGSISSGDGTLDLASLAQGLQGIQTRLAKATSEIKRAQESEKRALDAAQRVNSTNQELTQKLRESDEALQSIARAQANGPALAVRVAAADDNSHIPSTDSTHIVDSIDKEIDWSLKHGSDLLITGPTGCGKTAPIIQACARSKRPMRRVCFDGETTSQDLIGRRDALEGKTIWTDGILPQAMEAGQVLLVDEIDRADESARAALFSVLDSRSMYLPVPNKRIVAAAGFLLIAACNGVGDNSGAYTGTQPIDAAFLGRWLDVVRVEYPNQTREAAMLMAAVPGINEAFVKKTCEFFSVLRKAETDGNLTGPFSIRQSKRMAQLYFMFKCEGMDVKQCAARAAIRTLIDRTTEDNRSVIREAFQRVYGFECKGV